MVKSKIVEFRGEKSIGLEDGNNTVGIAVKNTGSESIIM